MLITSVFYDLKFEQKTMLLTMLELAVSNLQGQASVDREARANHRAFASSRCRDCLLLPIQSIIGRDVKLMSRVLIEGRRGYI